VKPIRAYFKDRVRRRLAAGGRLFAALAAGALLAVAAPAAAQSYNAATGRIDPIPGEKMLLEADQLLYDFDGETVTAVGNVTIYYGLYTLDAERVIYQQKSGRLVASGGVRMLEPNGNIVTAETIDITDDFRDGFVDSLNVITVDRAHFSAQTAERRDGRLTIFNKGVYSACAACQKNPGRPPLWQIKASRIIHDSDARTVYYENARLEFFGVPIAYVPVFFHPDPTVRRKTGFLTPSVRQSEALGFGVTAPFFWNLAPDYDVTFSPTYYSRQGLLMQSEWRQRMINGSYSIRLAGIFQQDKEAFRDENGDPLSGYRDFRGSVRTAGEFAVNPRWTYGWDLNASSDRTFNRDYRIPGADAKDLPSTVYLTGLSDRNFFDLRGYYFRVQREDTEEDFNEDGVVDYVHDDQEEQAVVHPVLDHNYIVGAPVLGGELRFDSNFTSLTRQESDIHNFAQPNQTYAGVAGTFTRATSRVSWKRRYILPGGQLVTPLAYLQGDLSFVDANDPASGLGSAEAIGRAMPAVGVQYEWPFLATLGSSVHTFGPKAQLVLRPDEQRAGDLPNEDSQSLVFDDTSLFQLDKFSGYDRQEGGSRVNFGLVYQGLFPNGASVDALVGQSYQLAGRNSFTMQDHALTGLGSGLETDRSDYVGRVTVNTGTGVAVTGRVRMDDDNFALNRGEVNAIGTFGDTIASLGYAYIRESAAAGIFESRQEISGAAKLEVVDRWSVLGSLSYDIENQSPVTRSLGVAYSDECFDISAVYSETPERYSDLVTGRQVFVRINLRTLGDGRLTSQLPDADD
jgi:LPS-assembly protein